MKNECSGLVFYLFCIRSGIVVVFAAEVDAVEAVVIANVDII